MAKQPCISVEEGQLIAETLGKKNDKEKDRWDLLPLGPIVQVVRVLAFGARKYGEYNWKDLKRPRSRYYSACLRHLCAWKEGEERDRESKLPHLAHSICCLIFILYLEGYDKWLERI